MTAPRSQSQAIDGTLICADELARVTAANLAGEFATVLGTRELTG
jgi:hypothetical protein